MRILLSVVLACFLLTPTAFAAPSKQQYVELPTCTLASGDTVVDCRLGYRAYGTRNADSSNVVVIPAWFGGHSSDTERLIKPGGVFDSSRFFVIATDILGNGVSTSPSNSNYHPRLTFPHYTIADLVQAQEQQLAALGIRHVYAVVGISMGGMQAFQWAAQNPGFMDKVVVIAGTPRPSTSDLLLWNAAVRLIEGSSGWQGGNYRSNPTIPGLAELLVLSLTTPSYQNRYIARGALPSYVQLVELWGKQNFDMNDRIYQLRAIAKHDIFAGSGFKGVATGWKLPSLIVVNRQDRMVQYEPALRFGQTIGAQVIELDNDCGHTAPLNCDGGKTRTAVAGFL